MILMIEASTSMHYHVETNALICLIKRLAEAYSGGDLVYYISCYQKLCRLLLGSTFL